MSSDREACGRCGVSTVVEAATDEEEPRDPYGEERIELDAETLRRMSPTAYLAVITDRLDRFTERFVWNR